MLYKLSNEDLEHRARVLEGMILREPDVKKLPTLNKCIQQIVEEQARRDFERLRQKITA